MSTFPPKSASQSAPSIPVKNCGPTSLGNGGIPASLKVKAAGTKDAPGLEKNVNLF